VRNTGSIAGSEITQLLVAFALSAISAHIEGILKNILGGRPVLSRSVELRLDKYAVSSWSENSEKWVVENGSYAICISTSSQELPLTATMNGLGCKRNGRVESCIKNCVVVGIRL
jgi:beta-glucosidase